MQIHKSIKRIESSYRRQISVDETNGGFIFVAKHWLDFFPQGKKFKLMYENKAYDAMLESINCFCVGPQRPHKHFHIKMKAVKFNKGDTVVITKEKDKYLLRIVK